MATFSSLCDLASSKYYVERAKSLLCLGLWNFISHK